MACAHGDQRLATAGSGDVLSGIVGALLSYGLAPLQAATLAAWVHGDAARRGPARGLVASDLLAGVARSLSALRPLI
jgi:NAD(P)H-hydrate epimerase